MQKKQLDNILNNLDQQIKKEIHSYFLYIPKNPLYHYTNVEAFKNIIASRKLWMTDYRSLDDKKEIKYVFKILKKDIMEFYKLFPKELLKRLKYHFNNTIDIFTLSACKVRDHACMWKKYTANGTGFAIGFKPDYFEPSDLLQNQEHVVTIKIHYDRQDIRSIIEKLFNLVNSSLYKKSYSEEEVDKINLCLLSHICTLVPAIKPDKQEYKEEHEHRLYRIQIKSNGLIFPKGQKEFKIKTNLNNDKNYIESSKFAHKKICEIILGPNCSYSKSDIIDYLKSNKYDTANIIITKSEVKP